MVISFNWKHALQGGAGWLKKLMKQTNFMCLGKLAGHTQGLSPRALPKGIKAVSNY